MKTLPTTLFSLVIATAFYLSACSKDEGKSDPAPSTVTEEPAKTATDPNLAPVDKGEASTPPPAASFATEIMTSYEACRALLAADKGDGIVACAEGIVAAAKVAMEAAPEDTHEHITNLIDAATALAKTKSDDMEAMRLGFGVVSESVVGMLVAAPDTAKNYHVFECPMAKGYQRWAQPNAKLENPYMGTRMLACGSEVHDHHAPDEDASKAAPEADPHGGHKH